MHDDNDEHEFAASDEPFDEPTNGDVNDNRDLGDKVKRTASWVAGNVSNVVKQAMTARDHVLMVRINDESLARINDLKDADLFRSRSEAAAYLIAEGIEARRELFDRISERISQIQDIKDELRTLAGAAGMKPSSESDEE